MSAGQRRPTASAGVFHWLLPAALLGMELGMAYPLVRWVSLWPDSGLGAILQLPLAAGVMIGAFGLARGALLSNTGWRGDALALVLIGLLVAAVTWIANPDGFGLRVIQRPLESLATLAATTYFAWRGMHWGRQETPHPYDVSVPFGIGVVGLGVLLAVWTAGWRSSLRGAGSPLPLVALFFACGLLALAVTNARITWSRASDPATAAARRRWMGTAGGVTAAVVGVALLATALVSPGTVAAALAPFQYVAGLLLRLLFVVLLPISILVGFLIVALQWLVRRFGHPQPFQPSGNDAADTLRELAEGRRPVHVPEWAITTFQWGLLLLVVAVVAWLVWRTMSRRRAREAGTGTEVVEALGSWARFQDDLLAWLRGLFQRRMERRAARRAAGALRRAARSEDAEPQGVREMYRDSLVRTALRGLPRQEHETPFEYATRINASVTPVGGPLAALTDTYVQVRYGDQEDGEPAVSEARRHWRLLRSLLQEEGDATPPPSR